LEPFQQVVAELPYDIKFRVHLKDEYNNAVDFTSLFAKQRQKQHELLCFQEPDGSAVDTFFTFARYENTRNTPLVMQAENPFITLKHKRLTVEESSVLITFAIHTGNIEPDPLSSFSHHEFNSCSGCGALATYYSSTSLTSPVATRLVPSIDFSGASLGSQPVASLASGAGWSVRWAGFVRAPVAGGATWTFFIGLAAGGNGGNGVRGWVDGVAVVNGWSGVAGGGEVSGTVVLSGASNSYYEVVVEYKAVGGAYGCTLSWQNSGWPKQVLPAEFVYAASHATNSPILQFLPRVSSGEIRSVTLSNMHFDIHFSVPCASKTTVSSAATVYFTQGTYPAFTISVNDIFGDPFPCSLSTGCAVGGILQIQNHENAASALFPPRFTSLPLVSSASGCCSPILNVPQELIDDAVYNVTLFLGRGDAQCYFSFVFIDC
jgi:hypothetical protein